MRFFLMFLQLAPHIIDLVKKVEELIPEPGKGKEKLDLVLTTVNTAVAGSTEVAAAVAGHDLEGSVKALVATTVATANATGAFKK
mgnify:CR=1 FL=1